MEGSSALPPEIRKRNQARMIDLFLYYFIIIAATIIITIQYPSFYNAYPVLYWACVVIGHMLCTLGYAFMEAILMSKAGYTLGKWTIGIRVKERDSAEEKLPFHLSIKRSFLFVLHGMWLGIPIISFIVAMVWQQRYNSGAELPWDRKCKTGPVYGKTHYKGFVPFLSGVAVCTALALVFMMASPGNAAEVFKKKYVSSDGNFGGYFTKVPTEKETKQALADGSFFVTESLANNTNGEIIQIHNYTSPWYKPATPEKADEFYDQLISRNKSGYEKDGFAFEVTTPRQPISGATSDGTPINGCRWIFKLCKDGKYTDGEERVYILPGDLFRYVTIICLYPSGKDKTFDYSTVRTQGFIDSCFYK